jgi:hypothetical protein
MRIKGIVTFSAMALVLNKTKGRGSCGIAIYKGSTTRLYNFMLNDQTMDFNDISFSVLFQIILFSSFILIFILK